MPPCYTFNKMCLPDDGMALCTDAGSSSCAATVTWFWLLAGVLALTMAVSNQGGR